MNQECIAFVPARGGSKSIPLKNIKHFNGRPLIYWVLRALQYSPEVDRIYLATDHDEIDLCTQGFGFSKVHVFRREPENASDKSSTESVMMEFLSQVTFNPDNLFVLVQATSPFLTSKDITIALQEFKNSDFDSMLSCTRTKRFYWKQEGVPINYDFRNRPRRQEFEGWLMENGAFYVNSIGRILRDKNRLSGKVLPYEMEPHTSFELDEPDDWFLGEALMRQHGLNEPRTEKKIKLVLTDVDGVLTDGGMYYSEGGDESKKFNTLDGKGFELLRLRGIKTGIITSEKTELLARRATKIKSDFLFQGILDKKKVIKELCSQQGILPDEIAYIGDDINDFELLSEVGIAACPDNAMEEIRGINNIIHLKKKGGEGAFREFVNYLIATEAI